MAAAIAFAMPWAGSGQSGALPSMRYAGTCKGSIDGKPVSEKPCTLTINPPEQGSCGSNTLRTDYAVNGFDVLVGAITAEGTKFTAVTCPVYAGILNRSGGGTADADSLEGSITGEVGEKHAVAELRGKKITVSFQAKASPRKKTGNDR